MNTKKLIPALSLWIAVPFLAANAPKAAIADATLKGGAYTAKVNAMVCEGCADFITQALKTNRNVENIAVDPKTKTVAFTIKPNAQVKVSALQAALKAKADEMGMGANYSLSELQPVKK